MILSSRKVEKNKNKQRRDCGPHQLDGFRRSAPRPFHAQGGVAATKGSAYETKGSSESRRVGRVPEYLLEESPPPRGAIQVQDRGPRRPTPQPFLPALADGGAEA